LIEDAKRHGVRILPVNVQTSMWDCTLIKANGTMAELGRSRPGDAGMPRFAVQVGLRYVKGLSESDGERIVNAHRDVPFQTIDDFVSRTGCNDGALTRLAESGAFESIEPERRNALWKVRGAAANRSEVPQLQKAAASSVHETTHVAADRVPEPMPEPMPQTMPQTMNEREVAVTFKDLNEFETVAWDYESTGHSPRGHPLSAIRHTLKAQGLPDARGVAALPDGSRVRYAGIVITRQRPGTAKGVVFMTMEDESGFVNVVLWKNVFDRHAVLAKTSSFLGITGKIQSKSGVVHLVADELWAPKVPLKPKKRSSRDFH